jgi:hypothetical protein
MHLFQYLRRSRAGRISASLLILLFLSDVLYPTAAWALTSGPTQPEFTSFEPVVTTNMVNEFTGDFTYNLPILQIPGPNGGGYAMSLSYHSGASPEEEASWVGYGWTLNPGAINRQRQGIPDDWNGEQMHFYNKTVPNRTVTAGGDISGEAFSWGIPASANGTIRYNNYTGFGYGIGAGLQFCNCLVSLGFHINDGQGSFSLSINPAGMLANKLQQAGDNIKTANEEFNNNPTRENAGRLQSAVNRANKLKRSSKRIQKAGQLASAYGMHALVAQNYPLAAEQMHGKSYKLGLGLNICPSPLEIGFSGNVYGQYTSQESEERSPLAFGYLHSGSALMGAGDMMDYHSENTAPYNKRDKFLPLPVNDADRFNATGEGIIGGMRFYNRHEQTCRPQATSSHTDIYQIGAEVNLGWNNGGSVNVGTGYQEMTVGGPKPQHETQDAVLRMDGDLGGDVGYSGSDLPENAHVDVSGVPGFLQGSFDVPNGLGSAFLYNAAHPAASSAVGFHTDADMLGHPMRNYEKTSIANMTGQGLEARDQDEHLGEISVLNEQGQRYNYGLPEQARNERSLAYQFSAASNEHHWTAGPTDPESSSAVKIGSSSQAAYATAFLLTSITDPDYVDRTNDGPTPDDIGGYTRFIYARHTHDGTNAYFNWRTPYEGYAYSNPELSECHDDRITYSAGEKEVYYLDTVMTRTHVAVFRRSARMDGLGANTAQVGGQALTQTLEKLDKIDLYTIADIQANGANARPIKTVRFAYAADADGAWPGIPNSSSVNGGKLTLTKVWFEYNGVVPARVSPYEFEYKYPSTAYDAHQPEYDGFSQTGLNETPSYSSYITDPWGNYRDDGEQRYGQDMPWLDQTRKDTSRTDYNSDPFDPAAWQLKVIKLPSGGELHVQYEEDSYAYVQNEKAHVLLPLTTSAPSPPHGDNYPNVFRVDLSDLRGIRTTGYGGRSFTATDVRDLVQHTYIDNGRKMFFKFFFGFNSDQNISGRNGEWISGYFPIASVQANDGDGTSQHPPYLDITPVSSGTDGHSTPQDVCKSLYNAEKRGKDLSGTCSGGGFSGSYANGQGNARSAIENVWNDLGQFVGSILSNPCANIKREQCYLRIPVGREKRGGGIRVKRLLMVDPQAMDEGYPGVYGSEYEYITRDGAGHLISSGVATYEPGGLREENPMVRPLDRFNQDWLDRAIAGRDRKQSEGPEGESLYPAPSVGYSRVTIKNIHSGPTAPAFTVKTFNTAKDYPVRVEHTEPDIQPDYLPIITGIVDILKDKIWASQGYTVHLNEMNGKPAGEAEYSGDPKALLGDAAANAALLSSTSYEYFGPDEEIPVLTDAQGNTALLPLGRTCDITAEQRTARDETNDESVEVDLGFSPIPLPPFVLPTFSMMPSCSYALTSMTTHTITKVIEHPAILRRTKVYKDGIWHISENAAFDRNTGEPVVVRTHDGFYPGDLAQISGANGLVEGPGTYTSVTIPASMEYPNMGQAAIGEGMLITSASSPGAPGVSLVLHAANSTSAQVTLTPVNGGSVCDFTAAMCSGDLMELRSTSLPDSPFGYYHLDHIDGGELYLTKSTPVKNMGTADVALPNTANLYSLLIVRSGCTNQLKEQAGTYTYYGTRNVTTPQTGEQVQFVAYLNDQLNHLLNPSDPATVAFPTGIDLDGIGPYTGPPTVSLLNDSTARFDFPRSKCDVPVNTEVRIDPASGLIVYGSGDCMDQNFCQQFAKPYFPPTTIANVVASAATHFSDNWPNSAQRNLLAGWDNASMADADAFDLAERGKWRTSSHYTYNTDLTAGTTNKDQGMYPMVLHNWAYPPSNDDFTWVRTDSVTAYSPDGNVLEERDALWHPSCAKFGYDHTLPYLVAKNSIGGSVLFDSFEKDYVRNGTTYLEDGVALTGWQTQSLVLDDQVAHAGHRSLRGTGNGLLFKASNIQTPSEMSSRTLEVKAWIRVLDATGKSCNITPTAHVAYPASSPTATIDQTMSTVARTGEWVLYSGTVQVPYGITSVNVSISEATPDFTTWIDDVRIQPAEAQMTSYVYDPKTFRLLATFDDQHFGLYYQYNDEGKLVRKLIETEHGIRTLQETQYNTPSEVQ